MNPLSSQMEVSLDPIIYFYTHSLLIIAVSALVFLGLGFWMGHLTWAKFKRRARAFQEECDLLRHEIAALKRRIGEETAGLAPLVLINEDAPVPVQTDEGPALPGFDITATKPVPVEVKKPVVAVEPPPPVKAEPHRENLASVVIGLAGAVHHTLEPVAPPDSIADFAMPAVPGDEKPVDSPKEQLSSPQSPQATGKPAPQEASAKASEAESLAKESAPAPEAEKTLVIQSTPTSPPEPEPAAKSEPVPEAELPTPVAADPQDAFAAELAEGTAVNDPTLGILLRFQPERWDDLTLLRGVGEVLQQRLHDHGVHTFKQIAYWTEANVAAFSSKIEARDRIQREHWVNQARDMHFLKYGEKLA